jgi:hypothetical protein
MKKYKMKNYSNPQELTGVRRVFDKANTPVGRATAIQMWSECFMYALQCERGYDSPTSKPVFELPATSAGLAQAIGGARAYRPVFEGEWFDDNKPDEEGYIAPLGIENATKEACFGETVPSLQVDILLQLLNYYTDNWVDLGVIDADTGAQKLQKLREQL